MRTPAELLGTTKPFVVMPGDSQLDIELRFDAAEELAQRWSPHRTASWSNLGAGVVGMGLYGKSQVTRAPNRLKRQ